MIPFSRFNGLFFTNSRLRLARDLRNLAYQSFRPVLQIFIQHLPNAVRQGTYPIGTKSEGTTSANAQQLVSHFTQAP